MSAAAITKDPSRHGYIIKASNPKTTIAKGGIVGVEGSRSDSRSVLWKSILCKTDEQKGAQEKEPWANLVVGWPGHFLGYNNQVALVLLKRGISSSAVSQLSTRFGVPVGEMALILDVDRTTAQRRANKGQPLPTHNAENVLRVLELEEMANDTFESEDAAHGWLRRPHPMLDGESPLEAAKTSYGARRVKEILVAITHGGVV